MPVMEIRRDERVLQGSPRQMDIGVVKHRLEADDDDVGIYHVLFKAKHVQPAQHARAGADQLEHVLAPVHRLCRMMHRVEAPQERHLVIAAMEPVLNQVRYQDAYHDGRSVCQRIRAAVRSV